VGIDHELRNQEVKIAKEKTVEMDHSLSGSAPGESTIHKAQFGAA